MSPAPAAARKTWPALRRAYQTVPPASLQELRPPTGTLALLCVLPGCRACKAHDAAARRAFEATIPGLVEVWRWDCSKGRHKALAMAAGVSELPAYIFVPAHGRVRVVRPG